MEAIVLAGGLGTRLRQLVSDVPKPMALVAGRPFLEIVITSLAHKGFSRVILSVGFMADKISRYFGSHFAGMELVYAVEEQPLGTGGAILLAMEQARSEHLFVFNGDTFLDLDVDAIERQWRAHQRPLIVAREVADTLRYGRLLVVDGVATEFSEKGTSGPGLINAGCYLFRREQLEHFSPGSTFSLEIDYLMQAVMARQFDVFVTQGQFIDIGLPADYLRAQTELADLAILNNSTTPHYSTLTPQSPP
ncbi:MAG: nucleotidyltransferase family protein [Enterobacteriaceae bacterium]